MGIDTSYAICLLIGCMVTLITGAPTVDPVLSSQVHEALNSETNSLTELTHAVLDRYKLERFHNPDVTAAGISIIGLPDNNQLTQHIRITASEDDLIQTRIDDLKVFHDLLESLEADERSLYREDPANFVDEIVQIRVHIQRVLNKAGSVMTTENLVGTSLSTYPQLVQSSITAKIILQFYTLKTLESAYYYLIAAQRDFVYLADTH